MNKIGLIGVSVLLTTLVACSSGADSDSVVPNNFTAQFPFEVLPYVTTREGNSNNSVEIKFHLSQATSEEIALPYRTQPISATADRDYISASGILRFAIGELDKSILLDIIDDDIYENPQEKFKLLLMLGDFTQEIEITIEDNDSAPAINEGNQISIIETDQGRHPFNAVIELTHPSAFDTKYQYQLVDKSATVGQDYQSASGELVFAAGETQQSLELILIGDLIDEPNEQFILSFIPIENADYNSNGQVIVTIIDNDASLNLTSPHVIEGNSGVQSVLVTASLSKAVNKNISLDLSAFGFGISGATIEEDFQLTNPSIYFAPGQTLQNIEVQVFGDNKYEVDETLVIQGNNPVNIELATNNFSQGVVTITNDDPLPVISFVETQRTISEDANRVNVALSLDHLSQLESSIDFTIVDVTSPITHLLYNKNAGTLRIPAESRLANLVIPVRQDFEISANETIEIHLDLNSPHLDSPQVFTLTMLDKRPRLNDSGVISCADAFNPSLSCPVENYPNQDADHGRDVSQRTPPTDRGFDFTKISADGQVLPIDAPDWACIKDNVTGLYWEHKTGQLIHNPSNKYSLSELLNVGIVHEVNQKRHCGFSNWRLPLVSELFGLLNFSGGSIETTLPREYFGDLSQTFPVWSLSKVASYSAATTGYTVDLGGVGLKPASELHGLMLVSSNAAKELSVPPLDSFIINCDPNSILTAPNSRYQISGQNSETVVDKWSQLEWQRCPLGMNFDGQFCLGNATRLNWQGALLAAEANTLDNKTDWRLPNIKEMESMIDRACSEPAINRSAFPFMSTSQAPGWPANWTSTPVSDQTGQAYSLSLVFGDIAMLPMNSENNIQLVRNIQ